MNPLNYRPNCKDWADLERGDFFYEWASESWPRYLWFWPIDSPIILHAAIRPHVNRNGASWELTGDTLHPTLTPSVWAKEIWHGFLQNGATTPNIE